MKNSYELIRFKDETESYIETFVSKEIDVAVNFSKNNSDELVVVFSSGSARAEVPIKILSIIDINSKTNSKEILKESLIYPLLFDLAKEKWLN